MSQTGFIDHNGTRILFIDFSNCTPQQILDRIEETKPMIQTQPEASLLTLTYVQNARFDRRVTQSLKEYTKGNKPFVRAAAVVGLSGLMEIILQAIVMFTRRQFAVFDSVEDAKEWLVKR